MYLSIYLYFYYVFIILNNYYFTIYRKMEFFIENSRLKTDYPERCCRETGRFGQKPAGIGLLGLVFTREILLRSREACV